MCVSYHSLNCVTNPLEFPIGQCDAAIEDIGDGSGFLYVISLDTMQGYHHIRVHDCNVEKLVLFAPDGNKYAYMVLPFGPQNSPLFYTVVIRVMQDSSNSCATRKTLFFDLASPASR